VIYNGVDLARFEVPPQWDIRESLDLPENVLLVASLGNIRPAKAYNVLIDAAAMLMSEYPQLHFIIAGHQKATLMEKLSAQLERLGVRQRFHFMGFIQDSAGFLQQADLFALPSSSEGFSIATIEAMAAGLPVLVTRCGGPEEIITAGENGLMVAPGNPEEFARGLAQYINSPELRQKMAVAGKVHIRDVFSLESMLDRYENEYSRLM